MYYISLVVKISTVLSLFSYQIYVIVHTSIANTYFVSLFDSCKGCFICLQWHAKIDFFQKLITRVPHNRDKKNDDPNKLIIAKNQHDQSF